MASVANQVPERTQDPATGYATLLAAGRPFAGRAADARIDTHAGTIFLAGDRAFKMKRPVDLGYLDFTTAEKRRAALLAELHLNRRTAPDLYIALHPIVVDGEGGLRIGAPGEPVDWILEMHRFPDDALLSRVADRGALSPELALRLADAVTDFHDRAAVASTVSGADRLRAVIEGNAASLATYGKGLDPVKVAALLREHHRLLRLHARRLDQRAATGRVRHCHGDLHLANIALIDGRPTPFDCLEFDPELATIDVLYDLAFLLMDLWQRGLTGTANMIFNRYLDRSGADEAGAALLPLFMSIRATIRAHVEARLAMQASPGSEPLRAQRYLAAACEMLRWHPPCLLAVGGRSGSGKSTLARLVGGAIGAPPGARILRSDVIRKRLAGVAPETKLGTQAYTRGRSAEVYQALDHWAASHLRRGTTVIADAAFLRPAERNAIAGVATGACVRFCGFWLDVPEAERIRRIQNRAADASDADSSVARLQGRRSIGSLAGWHRVAAEQAPADLGADVVDGLASMGMLRRPAMG